MDQSTTERGSSTTEALVSAALVLPAMVLWYLRLWPYETDWSVDAVRMWSLAWTVVLGAYFVVVVAVRARTAARRLPAVVMAVAATVLDFGGSTLAWYASASGPAQWVDRILTVVTIVLFVAAWGVARRCTPKWVIGLAPALVIAIAVPVLTASDWLYIIDVGAPWLAYTCVWIGSFLLGCLACWGFDAMGASAPGTATPVATVDAPPATVANVASPAVPQTNTTAIAALVSALVFPPLGIIFGHVALKQIKRTGDEGRGLAVAGLVIGYVVTVLLALLLILVVVYFAVLYSQI
ncbi:DUF4190 domain-containing protein [Mycobacterium sp. NPDC051804]|uniref:DUF4190 domain-containing protein n=1 Tax=Mycobacterium sp. NPDC051804 TaxID=3364295 RepID=UPI0037933581